MYYFQKFRNLINTIVMSLSKNYGVDRPPRSTPQVY